MNYFISGESFFRPMLATSHVNYMKVVNETLKFILVPAFTSEKEKLKIEYLWMSLRPVIFMILS